MRAGAVSEGTSLQREPVGSGAFHNVFAAALREQILPGTSSRRRPARANRGPLTLFRLSLPHQETVRLTSLLNQHVYPHMRRLLAPIPADAIAAMRTNYAEQLPKTMRLKSALIDSGKGKSYRAAQRLGIVDLLRSEELRRLGELATSQRLYADPGIQIICYEAGDFSGPHNDHHPEEPHLRDGYVDVHLMLPEPEVESQLLVYEKTPGLLNEMEEVGCRPAIAVYQLPFWHYTTPLAVRAGATRAKRWLLLASFEIDRSTG